MSLFDAFVGGAADQATGILNQQIRDEADLERRKNLAQFEADLAEAKMRTEAAIKEQIGQQRAQNVTDRVNQSAQSNANGRFDTNYSADQIAPDDTNADDRGDYQREVNRMQNKQNDAKQGIINSVKQDPMSRVRAANELGYIDDAKYAELTDKNAQAEARMQQANAAMAKVDEYGKYHTALLDLREKLAGVTGSEKDTTLKDIGQRIDSQRKEIKDDMSALRDEWKTRRSSAKPSEIAAIDEEYNQNKAALQRKLDESEELHSAFNAKLKSVIGGKSSAPSSTAPEGYKIVGQTPDGRTVYQGPDGKKFTRG